MRTLVPSPSAIDVVHFHGQTIPNRRAAADALQIGDGERLAAVTGISVVDDFRSADVAAGGRGAAGPPLPCGSRRALELAVLNIGGVANVTWIGPAEMESNLLAFDTGPGNALIDDWVWAKPDGRSTRRVGSRQAAGPMTSEYGLGCATTSFGGYRRVARPRRLPICADAIEGMSPADGAATLAAFTGRAVASALQLLPAPPVRWIVCGGGRYNPVLLETIHAGVGAPVDPVEAVGWRETSWKRRRFAYLAVRSARAAADFADHHRRSETAYRRSATPATKRLRCSTRR